MARALAHHLQPPLQDDVQRVRGIAFAEEDLVALEVDPGQLALDAAAGGLVERAEDLVLGRAQGGHAAGHQRREDGADGGLRGHRAVERLPGKTDQTAGALRARGGRAPAGQEKRSLPDALAGADGADEARRAFPGLGQDGEPALHHDVEGIAGRALPEEHFLRGESRLDTGGGGGGERGVRHTVEQRDRAKEGERVVRHVGRETIPPPRARRQARVSSGSALRRSRPASS